MKPQKSQPRDNQEEPALQGERFFEMVDEIRAGVKDVDPKELEFAIAEAVQAAKKTTSQKRIKGDASGRARRDPS